MSDDVTLYAANHFAVPSRAAGSSPDFSAEVNCDAPCETRNLAHAYSDQGISMVEIVISMFLLAVLSLALVPLLITVTQHTVMNRDVLAATSFAQSELTRVQAAFPSDPAVATSSCAGLGSLVTATGVADPTDTFKAFLTVSVCPVTYPGIVPVKITVKKDGQIVSKLSSHVRVAKAG